MQLLRMSVWCHCFYLQCTTYICYIYVSVPSILFALTSAISMYVFTLLAYLRVTCYHGVVVYFFRILHLYWRVRAAIWRKVCVMSGIWGCMKLWNTVTTHLKNLTDLQHRAYYGSIYNRVITRFGLGKRATAFVCCPGVPAAWFAIKDMFSI